MTAKTIKTLRFTGDLRLGHWSAGVFGGYSDAINFTDFSIEADGDLIIQADTSIEFFGQAKDVSYQPKPTKVMFAVDEFNRDLLADVVRGIGAGFSQTASASASATITLVKDKWVDLGTMNIGTVAITGLALDDDFEVDTVLGHVKALTPDAAGEQTVSFHRGAISGNKITAGNTAPLILGVSGRVANLNSGESGALLVPKLSISPKTALQIVGNKGNQEAKYEGFVMVPAGGQALFTFYPDLAFTAPT